MRRARDRARDEWVRGHLAEATRLATLLAADPRAGARVAEEALAAAGRPGPRGDSGTRFVDALLAGLVRGALAETRADDSPGLPDHLRALRKLPRRARAALILRTYAELSDDRASVFLGCSPRAVAELTARALEALPPDARGDVREWMDPVPGPVHLDASERRAIVRRSRRRRALRAAGIAAAVAAGVAGGLRLPGVLRAPEPPDAADRLRALHRAIELREADLPFDPDDAGPGTTRPFRVVDGVVDGDLWNVVGYRDRSGNPCLQLVVGYDFGTRRCFGSARGPILALVDENEEHEATFVTGMVGRAVESLLFTGPGVSLMDVALAREAPEERGPQAGFFGIALPDRLLQVESREAGRRLGYQVLPGRLTARDRNGDVVAHFDLLFAKRR
jgi:DNA-directed RNA polymerase specialized sigma24 family protein